MSVVHLPLTRTQCLFTFLVPFYFHSFRPFFSPLPTPYRGPRPGSLGRVTRRAVTGPVGVGGGGDNHGTILPVAAAVIYYVTAACTTAGAFSVLLVLLHGGWGGGGRCSSRFVNWFFFVFLLLVFFVFFSEIEFVLARAFF